VIAEVPLWVIHANDAAGGGPPVVGKSENSSSVAGALDNHIDRAQGSLSLLDSTGGSKKCAIYSVDMHPSGKKFATGGGDGTVRLWSSSALFSKHRAKFQDGGDYVSSESSDGGGPHSSGGEDNNDDDMDVRDDDPEELVHDLNSLVRRKKDGSTIVSATRPAATSSSTPDTSANKQIQSPSSSPRLKQQPYASSHRLLCTLSAHTGSSVLAVRFSTTGRYMASGGDDAAVCVYAPSSTSFSSNLGEHIEHWSRIKLCRGHTLDVVGLAWAPDDSHLVSCSLDSDAPIIVWKLTDLATDQRRTQANVLCNPYKILGKDIHTSTVKGVTFDPAGTYLASSGDDPAVCIWRAHDDWGLERKVDASSGIFRKWREDDAQSLSSQTLFRRLSWSTDGSYICSTNAVVKNKHVASTISREGWSVSNAKSAASGAANLVGHKQPIVVSRHAAQLLDARKSKENGNEEGDNEDEMEPDYATLLALGDKCGFVTVWSTRKSRPLFKLQCSETRCTVTDLAWGRVHDSLVLLVSLLDGHLVALRFGIPNELGPILSDKDQARVFQLRYGIDVEDGGGLGRRRLFVGESSGPKLIENALQLSLEERANESLDGDDMSDDLDKPLQESMSPTKVRAQQKETQVNGKKRIRPILMNADNNQKRPKVIPNGTAAGKGKKEKRKPEPLKDAMDLAAKATTAAENVSKGDRKVRHETSGETSAKDQDNHTAAHHGGHRESLRVTPVAQNIEARLPHSTEKVHTVDLPLIRSSLDMLVDEPCVADCRNVTTKDSHLSAVLSISCGGKLTWKDEIVGTSCCAITATEQFLAVGTTDGCVMLYGTSPSLGWKCGVGFRSHAPFVLGHPIVALQVGEKQADGVDSTRMLVVTADGDFGVYQLFPDMHLSYKGTVLPPMKHMTLSFVSPGRGASLLPKLARIQITQSDHLMLLLAHQYTDEHSHRSGSKNTSSSTAGGSLQAFVYNQSMELWTRMADSRFALSDFYTVLPATASASATAGVLSELEHAVRAGSTSSAQQQYRNRSMEGSGPAMYQQSQNDSTFHVITRSHCEDRMACALAVGSASEFRHWLGLYARTLAKGGCDVNLRLLVDMLLLSHGSMDATAEVTTASNCWWLSKAARVLNLDRKTLIKTIVIPEMSKNRALQRLTNEIDMEIKN
jgi:protein HIRA/HIR1